MANVTVRDLDRASRCPYCHDELGAASETWACPRCGARHHPDCAAQLGRCATWACPGKPQARPRRARRGRPIRDVTPAPPQSGVPIALLIWLVAAANIVVGSSFLPPAAIIAVHLACMIGMAVARSAKL